MRVFAAIFYLGLLSVFSAEVCSGASQAWFIDPWAWAVMFPLYTSHVLFFISLAVRFSRVTITHLYFLGVVFALYESWVTKVLWWGYPDMAEPTQLLVGGIAVLEFIILVFFWHPVMSFIVPLLAFETLTGRQIGSHAPILRAALLRKRLLFLAAVMLGTFIAKNNGYSFVSVFVAMTGTLLLIAVAGYICRGVGLEQICLGRRGLLLNFVYILALYIFTYFLVLPERRPEAFLPYLVIVFCYFIAAFLFWRLPPAEFGFIAVDDRQLSRRTIIFFVATIMFSACLFCFAGKLSELLLLVSYLSLIPLGLWLFFRAVRVNPVIARKFTG
ncbi:MAG: hypothetical protein PHC51_10655 [bacterium]|nr:hypothetical protein [bacterium]